MSEIHELRYQVVAAGHTGNAELPLESLRHPDAGVRASALRALARMNALTSDQLASALADRDPEVRRAAAELSVSFPDVMVHQLMSDSDVFVAEMAAWSIGERPSPTDAEVEALITNCTEHPEQLVREACAAALGSLADPRGRDAVLAACKDKPAVRRRAVLALAVFEGPEVEEAIDTALKDTDWQVRQNAEILRRPYNN